jgi:hypothetical protein
VRSNSFHRQNVQRLAGLSCKGELYASYIPSRSVSFDDCTVELTPPSVILAGKLATRWREVGGGGTGGGAPIVIA